MSPPARLVLSLFSTIVFVLTTLTTSATGGGLTPSVAQSSFALSTTQSQVAPSGQLTVNWTAPSGRPTNDWIALYKVGDANTTYGSWQYTQGATSGSLSVTAPSQAGRYEFRYLLQNGYTDVVRSNIVPITVAPSTSITSPANNATFKASCKTLRFRGHEAICKSRAASCDGSCVLMFAQSA